jgi:hypothetical protein
MLRLLQQHIVTHMKPLVDHVDELFKSVESLSSDLAFERARSTRHHDELSVRLNDIDRMVTSRPMQVANAVEQQGDRDFIVQVQLNQWIAEVLDPILQEHSDHQLKRLGSFEVQLNKWFDEVLDPVLQEHSDHQLKRLRSFEVQLNKWFDEELDPVLQEHSDHQLERLVEVQLNQWFAEVLDPILQEHSDHQTERLSNFDRLASSLQPALEQKQMIWGQLDSFSSRLSVAEAGVETTANSLQDHQLFIDLMVAQNGPDWSHHQRRCGQFLVVFLTAGFKVLSPQVGYWWS